MASILGFIPSLIKKFIGYTSAIFLLGWGAYDTFETKLNAHGDQMAKQMRLERAAQMGELKAQILVIKNDITWIKTNSIETNSKLDRIIGHIR